MSGLAVRSLIPLCLNEEKEAPQAQSAGAHRGGHHITKLRHPEKPTYGEQNHAPSMVE